ncbi:MAG: VCBS repeat-containing protein [Anaerolineae bacterium]|nr:VCBS repeat-containing protein [Anaerolineae bacterium]
MAPRLVSVALAAAMASGLWWVVASGSNLALSNAAPAFLWQYGPIFVSGVMGAKGPTVADVDNDGTLEIIVPAAGEGVDVINHDGTLQQHLTIAPSHHVRAAPTVANLDTDPQLEIIAITELYGDNYVYAFNPNGSVLWSFRLNPRDLNNDASNDADADRNRCIDGTSVCISVYDARYLAPNPAHADWQIGECQNGTANDCGVSPKPGEIEYPGFSVAVGDVDGDAKPEVMVAVNVRYNFNDYTHSPGNPNGVGEPGNTNDAYDGLLYAWNGENGTLVSGFPFYDHFGLGSTPAIADVDGDGVDDVIVHSDADRYFALKGNGSVIKAWGHVSMIRGNGYGTHPVAADVNGDGKNEVLMTTWVNPDFTNPEHTRGLHLFDSFGERMAGTPLEFLPAYDSEIANQYHTYGPELTPAVVDVDGDGTPEIITPATDKKLHLLQWNGATFSERAGWPKSLGDFMGSEAVVADVDGDAEPEIILAVYDHKKQLRGGQVLAWNLDGTAVAGWSISVGGMNGFKGPAAVGDLDNNGFLDIVVIGENGQVYAYSTSGNRPEKTLWSQHHRDAAHTGRMPSLSAQQPRGITAAIGPHSVSLSWSVANASGITGYKVYRRGPGEANYTLLTGSPIGSTSYHDSNLADGSLYVYVIGAVTGGGEVKSAPFAAQTGLAANLLTNPGFEANLAHWDFIISNLTGIGYNLASDTATYHRGRGSARVDLNSPTAGFQHLSQYKPYDAPQPDRILGVTPGAQYVYGGFIRTQGLSPLSTQVKVDLTIVDVAPTPVAFPTPDNRTQQVVNNTTGWIYVSRLLTIPAGITQTQINLRIARGSATTGSVWLDDAVFRRKETGMDQWVYPNAAWKYSDTGTDLGTAWRGTGYNDAAWQQGVGPLGYNYAGLGTTLASGRTTYYFRRKVTISSLPTDATLWVKYDDGFAAYLNGVLVARNDNMPFSDSPPYAYVTQSRLAGNSPYASSGYEAYDLSPFVGLFQTGTDANVLAIEVHQHQAGDTDAFFDAWLEAKASGPPPPVPIPLAAGWSLISLPVQPTDGSIATLVAGATPSGRIAEVWVFDRGGSNCTAGTWKYYKPGDGSSTLSTVDHKMGLWVKTTAATTLNVSGTLPPSTNISLCSGWNLVGYPASTAEAVGTSLSGLPVARALAYETAAGAWRRWDTAIPYAALLANFEPQQGYWLYATSAATWTVP